MCRCFYLCLLSCQKLPACQGFSFFSNVRLISSRSKNIQHDRLSKRQLNVRFLSDAAVTDSKLIDEIREAYTKLETDGILQLASRLDVSTLAPNDVVSASLQATKGHKGTTASILNAWIASCCTMEDSELAASRAQQLLQAFDKLDDSSPDILTFCLAYTAQQSSDADAANQVLERAQKMSKKQAGSKRRKVLAASRRKKRAESVSNNQQLQEWLGIDFQVLFENEQLIVINKPAGISCFHKHATTAGKSFDMSLEAAMSKINLPLSNLNPEARGLVHRLDRGTSGCLVMAKTDQMHALLVTEFFLRRVQKSYTTIVVTPPHQDSGVIDFPVDGRPAQSKYRVLKCYGNTAAQVEFKTLTGRKHQVRVHCAEALHSPVLWDDVYGNPSDTPEVLRSLQQDAQQQQKQRFFLHASSLSIPTFGVNVTAPLPLWWQPTLDSLEKFDL